MNSAPPDGRSNVPDETLGVVADEHRRAVLRELVRAEGDSMRFETLAEHVAARVNADDARDRTLAHRRRVRTALHHIHLPKLADVGMIEHDPEAMTVTAVPGELPTDLLVDVEPHELTD